MKHKISNKPVRVRETKAKGRAAAGGGGGAKDCANDFCAMERRLIYEAHRNALHNGMSTTFASAPLPCTAAPPLAFVSRILTGLLDIWCFIICVSYLCFMFCVWYSIACGGISV